VTGNAGKRPLPKNEPKTGPVGIAPENLCQVARAKWDELVAFDVWGPMATKSDREMLAEYCRMHVRKMKAESQVAEHGELVASPNGFPVQSPWLQIVNKCRSEMHRIQIEFGGSPSARTRVKANGGEKEDDSAAAYFG